MKYWLAWFMVGIVGYLTYGSYLSHKPLTDLDRCKSLYEYVDQTNPDIQALLKEKNTTLEALIEQRCNTWIENGQTF